MSVWGNEYIVLETNDTIFAFFDYFYFAKTVFLKNTFLANTLAIIIFLLILHL